jgi:predicted metal-dependent phosphoesterase TrpH
MTEPSRCDLHSHTIYSDSVLTPEELVRQAAKIGLSTLAITDHENTRGNREAQPIAKELGINLIPAVELVTRWDGYGWAVWGHAVDVLGYFIDWDHPEFVQLTDEMLTEYYAQVGATCEEATRTGYPVTLEEAFAAQPTYASVFSMVEALKHKGVIEAGEEDQTLDHLITCWQKVCEMKFPIERIINTLHAAGGVAVLAHPSVVLRPDGSMIEAGDLAELVEMGLDGVEVYHYRLRDEKTRQHFRTLAETFDLAISGGSDEHGRPEKFMKLGSERQVTEDIVTALRERSQQYR